MSVFIIADLHLDFWDQEKRDISHILKEQLSSADLVILAGDLTNKPKVRWPIYLKKLVEMAKPGALKIFPGNHDFYNYRIDDEDRLADFARDAGAEMINQKTIVHEDTRYICATLWTDFELGPGSRINSINIPEKSNDFRYIRNGRAGYRPMVPKDSIAIHYQHKEYIESELAKPFAGKTVVVTHHAPHPDVLNDYADNIDANFASDLTDLILKYNPDEWLFGHCHDAFNVTIGTTKLINISLGYPDDVKEPEARIEEIAKLSA